MELVPLRVAEWLEELVLEVARERAQPPQRALPLCRELHEMAAAVIRVALPLDQAALLELVEQADELAAVVAEGVGDRALRLVRPLVERDQDPVVVRVEAFLLVCLHPTLFRGEAQSLEQECAGSDQLLRKSLSNRHA